MQINGVVSEVYSKPVTTKYGPKVTWGIIINGERYQTGFKKPGCAAGDMVSVSYTVGQYGNECDVLPTVLSSGNPIPQMAAPAPATAPAASSGGGGYRGRTNHFPLNGDEYEVTIARQNALTNAVKFWEFSGDRKLEIAEQLEAVLQIALQFSDFTTGMIVEQVVEAAAQEQGPAPLREVDERISRAKG